MRNHAAGHDVALKHLGIARKRGHPFLNARAARIVQPDHGRAHFHGLIHELADFFGMRFAQGAAKHGEVLAEDEHQPPVDGAVAGNHPIAGNVVVGHAEIGAAVLDKHIPLLETAAVQQDVDPLAGRQAPFGMLCINALLPTAQTGGSTLLLKLFNDVLHGLSARKCILAHAVVNEKGGNEKHGAFNSGEVCLPLATHHRPRRQAQPQALGLWRLRPHLMLHLPLQPPRQTGAAIGARR